MSSTSTERNEKVNQTELSRFPVSLYSIKELETITERHGTVNLPPTVSECYVLHSSLPRPYWNYGIKTWIKITTRAKTTNGFPSSLHTTMMQLFVILIAITTSVLSQKPTLFRYDVEIADGQNFQLDTLTPVQVDTTEIDDSLDNLEGVPLADTNAFFFTFNCSTADANMCEKARTGYINAGRRLAASLGLNTPVNVYATYAPLTRGLMVRTINLTQCIGQGWTIELLCRTACGGWLW
jgi:hypothetical protein